MPAYTLYLISGPIRFAASEDDSKRLAQELQTHNDELTRLRAEVEALKATPPDQREDLRCVISDLTDQCRAANAKVEALKADARRLDWLLPVIGGDDDEVANERTVLIAMQLLAGKSGRELVDAAIAAQGERTVPPESSLTH